MRPVREFEKRDDKEKQRRCRTGREGERRRGIKGKDERVMRSERRNK